MSYKLPLEQSRECPYKRSLTSLAYVEITWQGERSPPRSFRRACVQPRWQQQQQRGNFACVPGFLLVGPSSVTGADRSPIIRQMNRPAGGDETQAGVNTKVPRDTQPGGSGPLSASHGAQAARQARIRRPRCSLCNAQMILQNEARKFRGNSGYGSLREFLSTRTARDATYFTHLPHAYRCKGQS